MSEHAGVMTRREVLELLIRRDRMFWQTEASDEIRALHWGAVGGISQVLEWPFATSIETRVRIAAHELALLMAGEREVAAE